MRMETSKSELTGQMEEVFYRLGGFGMMDAERWAGFCHAVGMDPAPFLKAMLENVCRVVCVEHEREVPSRPAVAQCSELWVVLRGSQTRFHLIEGETCS